MKTKLTLLFFSLHFDKLGFKVTLKISLDQDPLCKKKAGLGSAKNLNINLRA